MVLSLCCGEKKIKDLSDQEIEIWFSMSKWSKSLPMKPDSSIDKRLFAEQNILNPKSWEVAYKFLKENDLTTLGTGHYELSDDGTYANIEEYTTKDSGRFEAHRKYIDIQYLIKGKEYIYVSPFEPDRQTQIIPYNKEKDIEFFDKDEYQKILLTTKNFLVLFPSDAHQPCMKIDTNENVKKVVIKIPYVMNKCE